MAGVRTGRADVGHVVRGDAHAADTTAQAHFSLTLETMEVRLAQADRRSRPVD